MCESSEKCNNIKFEGDQFQNERAPFTVWDFHHEGAALRSNLEMTLESVLHSLVQLKARKTWPYVTP